MKRTPKTPLSQTNSKRPSRFANTPSSIDIPHLDLGMSRDEPKSSTSKEMRDIDDLIKQYKESCKSINLIKQIHLKEYTKHFLILLKIFISIYELYDDRGNELGFNLFDDSSLTLYKQYDVNFNPNIPYPLTSARSKLYPKTSKNYNQDNQTISINTILNRVIYLKFEDNKVQYNTCDPIDFERIEYIMHSLYRYLSPLPKYHCLDVCNLPEDKVNKILNILSQLNDSTKEFKSIYEIYVENTDYKDILQNIRNYSSPHINNNILYTTVNNNINQPYEIRKGLPFYYYEYDGPTPAMSLLHVDKYIQNNMNPRSNIYQPIDFQSYILNNIENKYKGIPPLYSKNLNEGLRHYIVDHQPIDQDVKVRLYDVMQYLDQGLREGYESDDIYIFHGTQFQLDIFGRNQFYLTSFLSCTFNIYVALDYAMNNLSKKVDKENSGIVYILKVDKNTKYINFKDNIQQILLLPGTKVHVNSYYNINMIKYVLCTVVKNEDENYEQKLYDKIFMNNDEPCQIKQIKINSDHADMPKCTYMDLSNLDKKKGIQRKNGKLLKHYRFCKEAFINETYLKHLLNDHIMNECYIFFLNMNPYSIVYDHSANNIYTAIDEDSNYTYGLKTIEYDINQFFIDVLFCHDGNMNPIIYKKHNETKQVELAWLGPCGIYDKNRNIRVNFHSNFIPCEYSPLFRILTNENKQKFIRELDIIIDKFNAKNRFFYEQLKYIRTGYIEFLHTNLNLDPRSSECIRLEDFINLIINTLIHRSKYFMVNMDEVKSKILQQSQEQLGGLNTFSVMNSSKSKAWSQTNFSQPLSKYNKKFDEYIKNIPWYTDTVYHIDHLKEPYRSYYKSSHKTIKYVDTSNRGFAISRNHFKELNKR